MSDLGFHLFPLRLSVNNVKNFIIKNDNIINFQSVILEIPFVSLFSSEKEIYITIDSPKFSFGEDIFQVLGEIVKKNKQKNNNGSGIKISRFNVKKGELLFTSSNLDITLLDFDLEQSFLAEDKSLYRLSSPHLRIVQHKKKEDFKLEGNMMAEFKQQQGSWKINRFSWNTEYMKISANGRFYKDSTVSLNLGVQGSLRKPIRSNIGKRFTIKEFIYGSARIKKDKTGKISLAGQFKANDFSIHGEEFADLNGKVYWDSDDKHFRIDASCKDDQRLATLKAVGDPARHVTSILIHNMSALKGAKIIGIEDQVLLDGIVETADFTIKPGVVAGTVTLDSNSKTTPKAEILAQKNFFIDGTAHFTYYNHRKAVKVHCDNMLAEFGRGTLDLVVDRAQRERVRIDLKANINEAAGMNKYTDFYIGLDLNPWKLKGGHGSLALDVKRIGEHYYVDSNFIIQDFSSSAQPIETLRGQTSTKAGVTNGTFQIEDKDLTGVANLLKDHTKTRITYHDIKGESQKILKILGFSIDLSGRMAGDFVYEYTKDEDHPHVRGTFYGKRAIFYGFPFDEITGKLDTRDYMHIKDLSCFYNSGKTTADILINYKTKNYKIDGNIKGIDLHRMHGEFAGQCDVSFSGEGNFAGQKLTDNDPIKVTYSSDNVSFYTDSNFAVKGDARIFTDFSNFIITPGISGGKIVDEDNPSPFTLTFSQVDGRYSGAYTLNLRDINLLIPWGNNKGEIDLKGQIFSDDQGVINTEGYAVFKGDFLSFPNFPHTLDNFEGDLIFKGLRFTLRSLRGTMGGGPVDSSGYLVIENDKLKDLSVDLTGKNLQLYPMDRTSCTLSTRNLTLKYLEQEDKLLFAGDLDFTSSKWEREVDEPITFNTAASLTSSGSKFIEMLKYDLRLLGRDNCQIDNSLITATGKFDLRLTGTVDFPQVTGSIECTSGKIKMADNNFDLVKAKAFFNKLNNNAAVDLEAETFIKNYHIKFLIGGTFERLKPQFRSSPPLPPRDILTLLSLGELFERPTTSELSTQVGAGTTGLIAQEITEQIKKRTKKIFGDYVLRINPNLSNLPGASLEDSSRLIVGKSIAKDFLIVYSTNFSTQRQQVVYVQYQLSPSISLIGMRNEEGRFSIDIRFRKRY